MWEKNNKQMSELVRSTGSVYAAAMFAAYDAKELQKKAYYTISESKALEWSISGEPPRDLEAKLKQRLKLEGLGESDRLDEILSTIDEDSLRVAVLNSYRASKRSNRLVYDYNGISNKDMRARVRILTRMIVIE